MTTNRCLIPAGHRVLVRLRATEQVKEVVSSGGIITEIKDNKTIEREKYAEVEAYVVKLGRTAFKAFDDGVPWCEEGDQVLICKYAGSDRKDEETGDVYRIINDEDIIAVFRDEPIRRCV